MPEGEQTFESGFFHPNVGKLLLKIVKVQVVPPQVTQTQKEAQKVRKIVKTQSTASKVTGKLDFLYATCQLILTADSRCGDLREVCAQPHTTSWGYFNIWRTVRGCGPHPPYL